MSSIEEYNAVVQELAQAKGMPSGEKVIKFLRLVCKQWPSEYAWQQQPSASPRVEDHQQRHGGSLWGTCT
eukprot:1158539-Pelagomonas_calceolata.AAC.2